MHNITNPREKNLILDDIVKILSSNGFYNAAKNQKINNLIIEYFLKELNINNCIIEYQKLDKGEISKVSESGDLITISTKTLTTKHQVDLATAVIHELRHIYQKENPKINKKVNQTVESLYPMKKCTLDSYQEDFKGEINTHSYYITSVAEKDARDYANIGYLKLLEDIKLHKNATNKSDKWVEKQTKKITQIMQQEDINYQNALNDIFNSFPKLKEIIPTKINLAIKQMQQKYANQNTVIGNSRTFDKYLYFYCDNNITKQILDFALKTKDLDSLITCINHPNTKINEQDFLNMLNVYSPKYKINDTYLLIKMLPNWDKNEVTRLCNLYNKKFTINKNQKNKNQKNSKLYSNLKNRQKQINKNKPKNNDYNK